MYDHLFSCIHVHVYYSGKLLTEILYTCIYMVFNVHCMSNRNFAMSMTSIHVYLSETWNRVYYKRQLGIDEHMSLTEGYEL